MAVELFSLVLKPLVSGFLSGASSRFGSWFAGQLLETDSGCGRCGHVAPIVIPNVQASHIVCPYCASNLNQFTNATSHTVGRNGEIAAAYISNIHWDRWGGIFSKRFNPACEVDCVNSKYEDLVFTIELISYPNGPIFHHDEKVIHPTSNSEFWTMSYKVAHSTFPEERGIMKVRFSILNSHGDLLHEDEALGEHPGKRSLLT